MMEEGIDKRHFEFGIWENKNEEGDSKEDFSLITKEL